jgi:hypothetical protein
VTASTTVTLRDKRRVTVAEASGSAGKRGVHIVFPRILVDKERAMTIRRSLVAALSRSGSETGRDWAQILDESVYKTGSGLRKLWATKTVKDKGDIIARVVPSEHAVLGAFRGTTPDPKRTRVLRQDDATAMKKRDIWRPDIALLTALPAALAPFAVPKSSTPSRKSTTARAPVPEDMPDVLSDACARILRDVFAGHDIGARFRTKRIGDTRIVVQTDSRSCPFRGGMDHTSNHAYATVDVHGVAHLACHGSKCKGRRLVGRALRVEELAVLFSGYDALERGTGIPTWSALRALTPTKRAFVLGYLRNRFANDADKVFQARMKSFGASDP